MEKLVLIDGNSLINRAFYALPPLTTKSGVFTNAVYGFLNMLFKIISEHKPTHLAVCFDVKAPTFRHGIYPEYKGTRKPMPDELRPQLPLLKQVLNAMDITCIEKAGIEADDIIGKISTSCPYLTLIFTGDKDALQLVSSSTEVHFTKRGITDIEVYNSQNFKEKLELQPYQIIELKALMGDTSDNIIGVPGVGEKTAKTLLSNYQTIENLYQNLDKIKGKLNEKLILGKESAILSKKLATIDVNCEIDYCLENLRLKLPFPLKARELFLNLELKSLANREFFELGTGIDGEVIESQLQISKVRVLDNADLKVDLSKPISLVLGEKAINLYCDQTEFFIPLSEGLLGDEGVSLLKALSIIKPIIEGASQLIVYDKKDLMHKLSNYLNVNLTKNTEDVSLTNYLTDFTGKAESLTEVIEKYSKSKEFLAYSLYQVYVEQLDKLKEYDCLKLYKEVELPLVEVLYSMEKSGFKIDVEALYSTGEAFKQTLNTLENKIKELALDDTLNVNSPRQLGEALFDKLKIAKGKKTKTGYSTSADELEKIEDKHPIVPLILEYRKIQKLVSTYIDGFKPLIEKPSCLIHTSFNQTVTATGRLSSKEPNLQNIPVREQLGRELRKFFVPKASNKILIGADYSQIELRLLADFSKTPSLVKAYNQEIDIHAITASKVFNTPLDKVTKEQRSRAKAVNFGIIYGISEYGLAKQLKISPIEAKQYITSYFSEYPEVKRYIEKNVEFAKKNGYSKTILNRRRYIKDINSSNFVLRSFSERVAMNMPLQGSSADIIKLAMLGVYSRLKNEGLKSQLILQVHDELIIDAFIDEQKAVEKILVEEMQNAVKLSLPLTVSVGSGKNWFEAK